MKSFWSFIGNDKYNIGCTGQTVYVYDKSGNELAKFKDLPYAYDAAISPRGDIFVVKTTEGRMAIYSLEPCALIKKFRYSKVDGAQDDNFCFSPDGAELYSIERHVHDCRTALSVYDTEDFSLKRRILGDDEKLFLNAIEYCKETDEYFLFGYFRNEEGCAAKFFVGKLKNDQLCDLVYITEEEHDFYHSYIGLRMSGFAKKRYDWSHWLNAELEDLKASEYSLAKLWNEKK